MPLRAAPRPGQRPALGGATSNAMSSAAATRSRVTSAAPTRSWPTVFAASRIAAASTYVDIDTAERIVARTLDENARRVKTWVARRGSKPNLAIRYRARDRFPTGRVLERGDDTLTRGLRRGGRAAVAR